ncbi:MAG: hypothetical protein ACI9J3_002948 [Parvicellaceae bacterium]|jgi:hypothetical protein
MKRLVIDGTDLTPQILGDPDAGRIEITGRSIPENATSFYEPLLNWIEDYKIQAKKRTELMFHVDYINSISQKIFYDILDRCSGISKDNEIVVIWKYDEDDEEILDEGKVFQSKFNLEFNLVEVTE